MKTTKRKRESAPVVETPEKVVAAPAATVAKSTAAKSTATRLGVHSGETQAKPAAIVLACHCNVKGAAALKETLCRAAAESGVVTIDVRSLERIDTAAMQLLCAFVRDRGSRDRRVEWLGSSAALDEAGRLIGVTAMLGSLPAAPGADSPGALA